MNAPDRPPEQHGHDVTFRYGVWVAPNGSRVEVIRVGGSWRVHTYASQAGGPATHVFEYSDQASVVRAIAELEVQGYRYDPVRRPGSARGRRGGGAAPAGRRSDARVVIAVVLLCILLLAVEYTLTR